MDAMILKSYKTRKMSTKNFPFEIIEKLFSYLDRECKDRILHIFYFTVSSSYAKLLRMYGLINKVINGSNKGG